MGMKFNTEIITVEIGDSIRETLKGVLEAKGLGDRMEAGRICIINDVTVKKVEVDMGREMEIIFDMKNITFGENRTQIVCEVEYEYE